MPHSPLFLLVGTNHPKWPFGNEPPVNTFTSSIQTEVDGLSAATSSYLTSLDSNIVSSSAQITALGFVSSS